MQSRSCDFTFYFGKKKCQWVDVWLWDVHPNTFARWKAGRWGYFEPTYENPRKGLFGQLHFVKGTIRFDTVHHEINHMWIEWFWAGGETVTRKNEERLNEILDKMSWSFRRALHKAEPRIKL